MARFVSVTNPYLFIPYRALGYKAPSREIALNFGVQFSNGEFVTDNEELAEYMRQFLISFGHGKNSPENKGIQINPPFYEFREDKKEEIKLIDEQAILEEQESQRTEKESESRLMKEFYSLLKG